VRGPGRTGRRDLDYEVKVYSPKSVYASDAGLGRRRRAGDTDPVLFHRTQFNKFLAAVDKMAEADKPDSRVEFKPLVFANGGMMGENTTKEFDQWKKEMGIGVRVLRRPVIRPDVQLLRLAIVAEGGD